MTQVSSSSCHLRQCTWSCWLPSKGLGTYRVCYFHGTVSLGKHVSFHCLTCYFPLNWDQDSDLRLSWDQFCDLHIPEKMCFRNQLASTWAINSRNSSGCGSFHRDPLRQCQHNVECDRLKGNVSVMLCKPRSMKVTSLMAQPWTALNAGMLSRLLSTNLNEWMHAAILYTCMYGEWLTMQIPLANIHWPFSCNAQRCLGLPSESPNVSVNVTSQFPPSNEGYIT